MKEILQALSVVVKEKVSKEVAERKKEFSHEIDSRLRSLNLFEYKKGRRMVDFGTRRIEVEPIPDSLEEGKSAILVSNYPSVKEATWAVLRVGSRLPGEKPRFKAIGRKEVITEAGLLLKAMGIDKLIFPAVKDDAGAYRLERGKTTYKEILSYLEEPGNVIWLSITGKTRGNGLLMEDLRTGAAVFSLKTRLPVVPMGIVTEEKKGKRKVVKVRFGEPISPPETSGLSDFEMSDFLIDHSKLIMYQIVRLLPPGQRGSFEKMEEK